MILSLVFSFLLSAQLEAGSRPLSADLQLLDEARLRKSLETIYGEFSSKKISEWQVAVQGKTQIWKWNGENFECPSQPGEVELDCKAWTPTSIRWFNSGRSWLEPWVSMRREGFFLGRPEVKARALSLEVAEDLVAVEESDVPEEEEAAADWNWSGHRLASREWSWVNRDGSSVKVFISLRNNGIERIDPDAYSAEYLEWKKENRWSKPYLSKIVLDKNGIRVSFQHLRNLKK